MDILRWLGFGRYNANGPLTPKDGEPVELQSDARGNLKVVLPAAATIQGPTGPAGATGATGPQGPAGATGSSGPSETTVTCGEDLSATPNTGQCVLVGTAGKVWKATSANAATYSSSAALGVVISTSGSFPTQTAIVRTMGMCTPTECGGWAPSAGYVRANATTGIVERVASFSVGDLPIGHVNAAHYLTLVEGIVVGVGPTGSAGQFLSGSYPSPQASRVADLAALRAIATKVTGDFTSVDLYGWYRYDSTGSAADDGMFHIVPGAGGGNWIHVHSGLRNGLLLPRNARIAWNQYSNLAAWDTAIETVGSGTNKTSTLTCTAGAAAAIGDIIEIKASLHVKADTSQTIGAYVTITLPDTSTYDVVMSEQRATGSDVQMHLIGRYTTTQAGTHTAAVTLTGAFSKYVRTPSQLYLELSRP